MGLAISGIADIYQVLFGVPDTREAADSKGINLYIRHIR